MFTSNIIKSEERVRCVLEAADKVSDPFEFVEWLGRNKTRPLVNIVTGSVMDQDSADQLLNAFNKGKDLLEEFVKYKMIENLQQFWEPIKRVNLPTFATTAKPVRLKTGNESLKVFKGSSDLFHRCSIVSQKREVDMSKVLSYELAAVPLSTTHLNGDMRKTSKSVLLYELEVHVSSTDILPTSSDECGFIIDLMALVHSTSGKNSATFADLLISFSSSIKEAFKLSNVVAVVPDRYDLVHSIKSHERSRRNTFQYVERIITSPQMKVPAKFRNFLSNPKNKMHLINFLMTDWQNRFPSLLKEGQKLLLSLLDGNTIIIERGNVHDLSLYSDHEEADSKMFVFAKYMITEYAIQRLIISSPDTDVFVLCCYHYYYSLQGCLEFFFKTGSQDKMRYISVHVVCNHFGASVCKLLPAFHCITGCDSTSSFSGVGKKSALKVLNSHKNDLMNLCDFGEHPTLYDEHDVIVQDAIKFVSWLYDPTFQAITNINQLRYRMFCQKKVASEKLPPTHDALLNHLKRANYQTYIWKNATTPVLNMPSPIGNGWKLGHDGLITQHLMNEPSAPLCYR